MKGKYDDIIVIRLRKQTREKLGSLDVLSKLHFFMGKCTRKKVI